MIVFTCRIVDVCDEFAANKPLRANIESICLLRQNGRIIAKGVIVACPELVW